MTCHVEKGNKSRSTYTIETELGRISKPGESSIDRDGRNAVKKAEMETKSKRDYVLDELKRFKKRIKAEKMPD